MDVSKISSGKNVPSQINVFVEIPQGSSVKYELDKDSGAIFVDRFLYTAMAYPFNYGFIPNTKAEDGDAMDVMLISSMPVVSGSVVPARPIGILEMEDEAGIDHKILAVPTEKIDPHFSDVKDVSDLTNQMKLRIKHFFESYKQLEPGKWVKIKDFLDKAKAEEEIKKSMI